MSPPSVPEASKVLFDVCIILFDDERVILPPCATVDDASMDPSR